jgi:hypothetical protein
MMINREDMLELTRRMNSSRTNFVRIAGAYMDEDGYIDGTFNTSFLGLHGEERERCLSIAKAVLLSDTNRELKSQAVPGIQSGSVWQMLYALRDCGLKNDAFLLNFYEIIAEQYHTDRSYAIYVYYGVYDVPLKAMDKEYMGESEEVYSYLIMAIAPTDRDQIPQMPIAGFLYPAFTDRSTDMEHINIYQSSIECGR